VAPPDGPKCKQLQKTFLTLRRGASCSGNESVPFPSSSLSLFQALEIDDLVDIDPSDSQNLANFRTTPLDQPAPVRMQLGSSLAND
jgi:hypothetical protein